MAVSSLVETYDERSKAEICDVIYRLARAIDRMDWPNILSLSDNDCFYDYGPYKGDTAGLVEWMRQRHTNVFRSTHHIGNIIVEFSDGAALAETYVNSVQTVPDPSDTAQQINVIAWARYIDEFRRSSDRWRLRSRHVVIDNQMRTPALSALPKELNLGVRDHSDTLWRERARLGIQ